MINNDTLLKLNSHLRNKFICSLLYNILPIDRTPLYWFLISNIKTQLVTNLTFIDLSISKILIE